MMITRALALAAAIGCALSSATAAPILQFSDNMDGTVVLQVVTDAPGSLGAEVAVEVLTDPGLTLTGVTVNEALFDTPNPGDNPFIAGSPVGGDSNGLWTDLLDGRAFASFGSGNPGIGTFDFLTLTVEGVGDLSAFGLVAQGGQLNSGLSASITVPEPATLVMAAGCLMAFAGCRRHV